MIKRKFLYCLLISMSSMPCALSDPIAFFDSMNWYSKENRRTIKRLYLGDSSACKKELARICALRDLYDKHNSLCKDPKSVPVIPKIIHQIWVGPNTPPAIFKESQKSLRRLHPDWHYKLWTDADLPGFGLTNQHFYDSSQNYGEKADILRYEILYRYGGVYVDIDFVCLKPLDELCCYDVWTSIFPVLHMEGNLNNGVIGSVPAHPIMRHCIETVKYDWHAFGPYSTKNIIFRVGPRHFERSFMAFIHAPRIIAFPSSYFYPIAFENRLTALAVGTEKCVRKFAKSIRPETYMVHCWAGSWWPLKEKKNKAVTSPTDNGVIIPATN